MKKHLVIKVTVRDANKEAREGVYSKDRIPAEDIIALLEQARVWRVIKADARELAAQYEIHGIEY